MSWIKDVKQEIRGLDTSTRSLRRFYILMLIVFGLLAAFAYIFSYQVLQIIGISGIVIFLIGAVTEAGTVLYKMWMALAFAMGWIMSRVLLVLVYYIVITPIGLLARLTGKKFLDTKFKDNRESFWIKREHSVVDYTKMS